MDWSWLGLAGLALLVAAWIPQSVETIRARRSALDWRFTLLYLLGSGLLTFYSILIKDLVFALLNFLAACMAAMGLYFKAVEVIGARRVRRKKEVE